jgi:uncharacterized HhH-GPD family protein
VASSGGGIVVVVVNVVVVVDVVVVEGVDVDVVVVEVLDGGETGAAVHVGCPTGSGAAPLLIAHVTTTVAPGLYCTLTRFAGGTPRLPGPSRRSSRTSRPRSGSRVVVVGAVVVELGGAGRVVEFGAVVGVVGGAVGASVGGVVGASVGGVVGAAVAGRGGETVTTVGRTVVVCGTAVVLGRAVVEVGALVVEGGTVDVVVDGCVGTATRLLSPSLPPSATNATRPMAHSAITAPAVTRAAVTSCIPLRLPCDRRMASAARAASTNATIVATIGTTMLTTAHTRAATANGSVRGLPPQPPGPCPLAVAPVGSGSGPTGTSPVSSASQSGGSEADTEPQYRRRLRQQRQVGDDARLGRLLRMTSAVLPITGDPEADQLLVTDPFALLVGMLLDQQVPMEWAFKGPSTLRERLGSLDAKTIAAMSPEEVDAVFRQKPALHRYPGSMAKRAHALAVHIVDEYDGDAAAIWRDAQHPNVVLDRLRALPGFGEEKARIFLAILGKRLAAAPPGWEDYARPFGDTNPRSVADVDSPEALLRVREWKQAQKKQGKKKSDL